MQPQSHKRNRNKTVCDLFILGLGGRKKCKRRNYKGDQEILDVYIFTSVYRTTLRLCTLNIYCYCKQLYFNEAV